LALQKGDYLFLSGHTASQYDSDSKKMVCKGNIIDQTIVAYEKIKLLVEAAGGSFDDVVKMTDYITPSGLEKYKYIGEVRHKYFNHSLPAVTPVVVHHLLRDALIEVEAVAVLGKSKKEVINPAWRNYEELACSPAVKKGDLIFLSGQVGMDYKTGRIVDEDDIVAQTEKAYQNIEIILNASGASYNDVVKTIDYISPKGLNNYKDAQKVRTRHFGKSYSAVTGVVIEQCLQKSALIGIDCIAVIGNQKKWGHRFGRTDDQDLTYRPVVKKGKIVFISGMVSIDMDTNELIGKGDVAGQMNQIFINIDKMLKLAGVNRNDILKTADFVIPETEENYRLTADVRRDYFKESFPASTGVFVDELLSEGFLIEVDVIAVAD